MPELGSHCTSSSMGSSNFAPDHTDIAGFFASLRHGLGLNSVYVSNAFAKVEVCGSLVVNTYNVEKLYVL